MDNEKLAANQSQPKATDSIEKEITLFALENNMPLHVAVAIFRLEAKRHFRGMLESKEIPNE